MATNENDGYLVIANIGKKDNVKKLIGLGVAYGIDCVLVVGQPHFDLSTHTPVLPGIQSRIEIIRLTDLVSCQTFLKERGVRLYGVEIVDGATSIEKAAFDGHPCAFMLGNEGVFSHASKDNFRSVLLFFLFVITGSGMNAPQLAAVDEFLYVKQFGNGTASLNVSNAAAIVLEHFALSRCL